MDVINRANVRRFAKVRLVGESLNEFIPATEALAKAEDEGLDLVIVSGEDADPPVVRIQDFKKIQYEKKKSKKSTQRKVALKEMQFKANISDHDFQTKLRAIEKFLERGDKVKVVVRLKGRERENPERAYEIIERVIAGVPCKSARVPGPIPTVMLEPSK